MCIMLLLVSVSVEKNFGPIRHQKNSLLFAMWNLDSIPARNYCRIPLIESFKAVYDFDIFGACESSLIDLIPNEEIFFHGFSLEPFRSNNPLNAHSGGVCLYYKPNLPIKQRKDLDIISETVVAELILKRKEPFFVLSYRHPNQTLDDLENYMVAISDIYEQIKAEKPIAIVLTGDFNARMPIFWENDTDTREGRMFSDFLLSNNLEELINHLRDDGTQSCIDLIFTDQPFIFNESGVLQIS